MNLNYSRHPDRPGPETIEARIRRACDGGDFDAATTAALEAYGPELLGFLHALLDNRNAADDAFSVFCEDLWRGLPGFAWRASARCWCYTLARHAAMRLLRSPHEQSQRHLPLSGIPTLAAAADRARSATTAPHLRSEVKSQIRLLREQLPADDQALLILRVDKDLSWDEVARVLASDGDEPLDDQGLAREVIRMRKRFQLVKDKLRKMAQQSGLL